jgi:hypothetical protein
MPETALRRSPKLEKGALVQLIEGVVELGRRVIPFQYNPQTLTRTLTPFNPFEVSETGRGQTAPTAQPFDPKEQISLEVELDANDQIEENDPLAKRVGVADRIAAIERLLYPATTIVGELLTDATGGGATPAQRPTVPVVLFTFGRGRIVPVRLTSYSVEEQLFLPTLYPLMARVSLGLEVLTPDVFKCQTGAAVAQAIAAYDAFQKEQIALAEGHALRNIDAGRGLLSF